MRIILFTGKGGCGKTTCAAATALDAARQGMRTLIMSTDPAHSLGDALNLPVGPEPTRISENLYAQELDIYYSMAKYWQNLRALTSLVLKWQGLDSISVEEMSALPGMEEASAFLWLEQHISENRYDTIILDSAPTGETLTLLTLPQATRWWTTKFVSIPRLAMKTFGSMVHMTTGIPLDKGLGELEEIIEKIDSMRKVFADGDTATIRVVTNPEKMVIQEAKRAYTYFQLYGYHVDAVIVNRILPPVSEGDFMAEAARRQERYLGEIREDFHPLPILKVPHYGKEVFGMDELKNLSKALYPDENGVAVMFHGTPLKIEEHKGGFRVILHLPFTQAAEVKISRKSDNLTISIHNRRRHLFLPRFLAFYDLAGYQTSDGRLCIDFTKK